MKPLRRPTWEQVEGSPLPLGATWIEEEQQELGITVVEFMPIFQRDPQEGDFWGYMPLNFFAPHAQYASSDSDCHQLEFKGMVKAFHDAGIGVVLDVVYNHTCEGDHRGPIYSYKGFGSTSYYMMSSDQTNPYANYSGTGNTLYFGRGHVRKMVMDSLRYWKREMHIDGFRFDLASVFSRNEDGSLNLWFYFARKIVVRKS